MFKYFFALIICFSVSDSAFCQKADTTILYYKFFDGFPATVTSLDEADFFRLVIPPDSGDNRYNIKEYYKNGKIKFVGKAYTGPAALNPTSGIVQFDGDCVSYYPNGKRSSITHYQKGRKEGLEYLFYPTGKVYSTIKHFWTSRSINNEDLYWECYDTTGNMICKEGLGKMILYDRDYKHVKLEGSVVNGYMDGEWHGVAVVPDTIKYICQYKKGSLVSSVGYDRKGNTYPFKKEFEKADYRSGPLVFLDRLRNHIKLPKDASGNKMTIDTMHVSFIVERDGKLSEFGISGDVDSKLKDVIFSALEKSNEWTPSKVYGIPFRTMIVLPLGEISGWNNGKVATYQKSIWYKERILKD
jgi:hypothetical protein